MWTFLFNLAYILHLSYFRRWKSEFFETYPHSSPRRCAALGNWVGLKKLVFDEMVKVVEQIVLLPSWSSTSEEEYSKKPKKTDARWFHSWAFFYNLIGGHRTPSFEKDI